MANEKRTVLLGMPLGTAWGRLRKELFFSLICRLDLQRCHRCGEQIETSKELSIEHTENWESASDPAATFFDLTKISFSHLRCNISAASKARVKIYANEKERKSAGFRRYYERKGAEWNKRRNARRRDAG